MKYRSAWWLAASLLLARPVGAQLADPAAFIALGMVSGKNACAVAHPDLAPQLRDAFENLITRSSSVLSREQWQLFEGLPQTPTAKAPSREDCAKLAGELRAVNIGALIGRARLEASCMQDVRAASERAGATRPAIGVDLVEGSPDARIGHVHPNSPASAAGLMVGDLVVEYAARPVESGCRLAVAVLTSRVGETVSVAVLRSGQQIRAAITPVRVPND